MRDKLTIAFFIGVLGILSIGTFLIPKREYSYLENRYLMEQPQFTLKGYMNGDYTKNLDSYLADHVIGKDTMIFLKNIIDRGIGRMQLGGVYYTNNKYLEKYEMDEEKVNNEITEYNNWAEAVSLNAEFYILPVPVNSTIYANELPKFNDSDIQDTIIKDNITLLSDRIQMINVFDALKERKEEDIYFRTDHHWTMLGAYYAYREVASNMGLEIKPLDRYKKIQVNTDFYGSLFSRAPLYNVSPDKMELYIDETWNYEVKIQGEEKSSNTFIHEEALEGKDKYDVFFGGNYGYVTIYNHEKAEEKLLVIKDSYANSLIPYMISDFSEIHMVDPRYYKQDIGALIKKNEFDRILILKKI